MVKFSTKFESGCLSSFAALHLYIHQYSHTVAQGMDSPNLTPQFSSPSNQTVEDDDQSTFRRIQRLQLHLNPPIIPRDNVLELLSCAAKAKLSVSTKKLSDYMRGKHRDIQERVFEYYFKSRPDLQTPVEISMDEHRELCMRQLLGLVREAGIRPFGYVADDPAKYFAVVEAVGSVDMSLGIKMGVQYR